MNAPGQASGSEPTFLRITAIRWLIGELIPFGSLAAGVLIYWLWWPGATLGFVIGTIVGVPITVFYLYKVIGAAVAWLWPIMLIMLAATIFNSAAIHTEITPPMTGAKAEVTSTWWLAGYGLAILLALTVAAAIANGEHWMRRNRFNLPRDKFEAYARSRGTLARLWLPR